MAVIGRRAALRAEPRSVHLPSDGNMWVFVLGDFVIFSSYFIVFMVYRNQQHVLFLESQRHLSLTVGVINTLVLLASSWFVAQGVVATRAGSFQRAMRLTLLGGACGVVFAVVKAYEWSTKIAAGLTFPHNDFFMFYYLLTGVHLFHVALGLVFLGVVYFELRNPAQRRVSMVETGATYWHMVDLLWVAIFALVYVLR
ncbi:MULTISPECIES: cytochrome c oxidase subunit 3 [unclassified Mycolicibacterium]|uniref:cytochrome c oxidase subunit 3 n=1 Tax=unclassified Mycolicibacterium TaxID=2636767 RepID=UPI0012DE645D|nr:MULTISPECIES: cytochrome c oxidase subunit 3 [unclassified Mycolicibacterium]MUL83424.1 cytochrome c oxidase subunit 3 family protein [Mycolicibacterium sp. CBMA 329]MUL90415.1 cytochrome c oxidase subunit 3 family protein [Mycolicibacterium sp. CBMA 331]MUM00388.1 cytochrome c oxidase subunit 3 family protein [Mycolicibacterium sp. CBMA 334]MUM29782.1 cytochrome c oxidase subunit 3 family protein [Mycolicibacterium sp. CBMA 295]MUM41359.1 cytochrome c oxidase subunit 3 family protein [Myco